MKGSRECVESRQLHKEGCQNGGRVELEINTGAPSTPMVPKKGKDDGNKDTGGLLERILNRDNMNMAYKRVKSNKGSYGIDGMTVDELLQYLKQNGDRIRQSILKETYRPAPVRRVEIPKPDGGKRMLGIPTVVDRVIQQAIAQVLTRIYEPKFSDNSYGFRPGRNAKQAIEKCKGYIGAGNIWVVDIDLARYFDTVNHDKLMALLAKDIADKRVLKLIRKYLQSGVMINRVTIDTEEGCPQGGPLSPLLSNVMLNELDKELEKRKLKFCRYADDGNIYVKSRKAAERVMKNVTKFLEEKLKLKVNRGKSTVGRPWKLKFLGFSFYLKKGGAGIRIHEKPVRKFRDKVKEITSRSNGKSMMWRIEKLNKCITGWVNYYGFSDMKRVAQRLDEWIRRRLRMCLWKQWKNIKTRHNNLVKLGVDDVTALQCAFSRKGVWRVANSPILYRPLTNDYIKNLGYHSISERYAYIH